MTGNHSLFFGHVFCTLRGHQPQQGGLCWPLLASASINLQPQTCCPLSAFPPLEESCVGCPFSWDTSRGMGCGVCCCAAVGCRLSADMLSVLWSGQRMGQKLHLAQHYCWVRCPRSNVWGMVPFSVDVGCSCSPYSALSSGTFTHAHGHVSIHTVFLPILIFLLCICTVAPCCFPSDLLQGYHLDRVFLPGNAVLELGRWVLPRLGNEGTCPECPQGPAATAVFLGGNPAGTAWDRLSLYCLSSYPKPLCVNCFFSQPFPE